MTTKTTKKCYLAGASAELERVEATALALMAAGFEITEPWWERIREVRSQGHMSDADAPDVYMTESAERNERGIRDADFCVFLCKLTGGFSGGMGYELGFASCVESVGGCLYVVGDHRRFVGIWTPPRPICVPSIRDVIMRETCTHQGEIFTVGPHGRCATCGAHGPFEGVR